VARFTDQLDDPTTVFGRLVVLELKFTGRFPDWFKELVRIFNLRQGSASKYADGIVRKGEHYFYQNASSCFHRVNPSTAAQRDARLAKLDNLFLMAA